MSKESKEIENLIERCLKGEEKAFKKLYDNYYVVMMRIAMRYSRDNEEAKDFLQTIFLKVVTSLKKFDNKGSFEGWIKRIAVNEAINYYKRINKSNMVNYMQEDEKVVSGKKQLDDKNIFATFEMEELMKLVQELPPAYRTVFNLYAIEDFSHKEIAKKLEISVGTSKSNLSRARNILRKKIEEIKEYEKRNVKK